MDESMTMVAGFPVDLARAYDPDTHLWVTELGGGRVRLGLDSLGIETSGTLAALAFVEGGSDVRRGEPFGSLEAAKFVGPLIVPVSGRVAAVNEAAVSDPSLVERDPYGAGWLVELTGASADDLASLVRGVDDVAAWFAAAAEDYRIKGVLAE